MSGPKKSRTRASPGSAAYYNALQEVFGLQSRILTAALPHPGERGSNDEERCRAFLSSVLPRRYSIGSGFVVSSAPGAKVSPQQDVVIFDDFLNSPLYRELASAVFPVEMVYATVEVKGNLAPRDLASTLKSIGKVRRLSMQCFYEWPGETIRPGRWSFVKKNDKRPPRAFIFAFDTTYRSADALKRALQRELTKPYGAHLHGIVVLSKNWFAFQRPFKAPAEIEIFTDMALLRFVNSMLENLKSVIIREAQMSRYLVGIQTAEPDDDKAEKAEKAEKAKKAKKVKNR
ncbi:MAG TPA: DUF6602 domain-containing protein [Burkholderiales bacterium]|nr:DUF6602 domain-containing protein [Burkholderiales bacterium]